MDGRPHDDYRFWQMLCFVHPVYECTKCRSTQSFVTPL
jgi:hypothetical protein